MTRSSYSRACRLLAKREPVFAAILQQFGPPPFWQRPRGFATLVQIILEQQVSLASGKAHFDRLHAYTKGLQWTELLSMTDEQYRACHISRQKMSYIRDLASRVSSGALDLDSLHLLPDEMVAAELCRVKGIGPWTASVYLMMCLNRPDHFPPGDIAAMQAARQLFPDMAGLDNRALAAATQRWSPYRTIATNYLWWWYLSSKNRTTSF